MIDICVIGLCMFAFGLYVRLGGFKALYLVKGTPFIVPLTLRNTFIPLGIAFFIMGVIMSNLVPDVET